jgi:hypothetical protein
MQHREIMRGPRHRHAAIVAPDSAAMRDRRIVDTGFEHMTVRPFGDI